MLNTGLVWSTKFIDSESIPIVSKELLPWLLKDRREAVEGAMVKATRKDKKTEIIHNGEGLDRAERELRRVKTALDKAPDDPEIVAFLEIQLASTAGKVAFYKGKIHLLDKIIEQTRQ